MKIRTKLLLLLTLGLLIPLVLSHLFSANVNLTSMTEMVREDLSSSAEAVAGRVNDRVNWMIDGMGLVVESVPFESFPADDLPMALAIPYRQLSSATLVALLDDGGLAVVPPYRPDDSEVDLMERERVTDADLDEFSKHVPMKLALSASMALGPVYMSSSGSPRMVVAMAFPISSGEKRWVLAVEYSLQRICDLLEETDAQSMRVARMVDTRGYSICDVELDSDGHLIPLSPDEAQEIRNMHVGTVTSRYSEGGTMLSAVADVRFTAWKLLLEQPEKTAMAPVVRSMMMAAVWISICILVAIIGGVVLAKGLSRPISKLEQASKRIAGGDYDQVLDVDSGDELGSLAASFNRMTEEIRAWNAELTERVDDRTRELKQAQEQILQTQKMAAVGELGSGVAHEINNPLTVVVGTAQLLQETIEPGTEAAESLDVIISNARRVAEVVKALLRLSQSQVASNMKSLEPALLLRESVSMFEGRLKERGIEIEWDLEPESLVSAVDGDMRLVFNQLLDNALCAMPQGGTLSLSVSRVEGGAVSISVRDSGVGMTEEVRRRSIDPFFTTAAPGSGSKGLGLATVCRVVEEHKGKTIIESEVGKGTKVTIFLPGNVKLSKKACFENVKNGLVEFLC